MVDDVGSLMISVVPKIGKLGWVVNDKRRRLVSCVRRDDEERQGMTRPCLARVAGSPPLADWETFAGMTKRGRDDEERQAWLAAGAASWLVPGPPSADWET